MSTVNKDAAFLEWARQNPYLSDQLLMDWLNDNHGSCAVVLIPTENPIKTYVNGASEHYYNFALQVKMSVSNATDDTNTSNLFLQRQWQDWIFEQEKLHNYPNFGNKCNAYRLLNLSESPILTDIDDSGVGTYQFYARLTYREVL